MNLHGKTAQNEENYLDKALKTSKLPKIGKDLAMQVREIRFKHRLSQEQLAKKMNVKQSVISRIECGRSGMTVKSLDKICSALGYEIILRKKE